MLAQNSGSFPKFSLTLTDKVSLTLKIKNDLIFAFWQFLIFRVRLTLSVRARLALKKEYKYRIQNVFWQDPLALSWGSISVISACCNSVVRAKLGLKFCTPTNSRTPDTMTSSATPYRTPEMVLGPSGRRRRSLRRHTARARDSRTQNLTPASCAGFWLSAYVAKTGPSGLRPAGKPTSGVDVPGSLDA